VSSTRDTVATSLRATITVTAVFALALTLTHDGVLTLYATFSAVAVLILTQFGGSAAERARAFGAIALVGAALVVAGSFASSFVWLAVTASFVAVLAVQGVTVFGGTVATLRLPLLLAWVLAAVVPSAGVWSSAALGWLIGTGAALVAALVPWPGRAAGGWSAVIAARALALAQAAGRSGAAGRTDGRTAAVRRLHRPPLVFSRRQAEFRDAAECVEGAASCLDGAAGPPPDAARASVATAAAALDLVARALAGARERVSPADVQRLADACEAHRRAALAGALGGISAGADENAVFRELVRTQRFLAAEVLGMDAARHALGAQTSADERAIEGDRGSPSFDARSVFADLAWLAGALLTPGSTWLIRSLPVALGVALAVLITQLTGLPHAFWIVLATVTVLRPAVQGSGRTYGQAIAATVAGALLGAGLVVAQQALGGSWLLWAAFPASVLFWSSAPSLARRFPFVASQAAFTVFLVVMFTLLEPAGYTPSVFRVVDVLIGGAVALLAGTLLWPRGLTAHVRGELAGFLRRATSYALAATTSSRGPVTGRETVIRTELRTGAVLDLYGEDHQRHGPPLAAFERVYDQARLIRLAADAAVLDGREAPEAPPGADSEIAGSAEGFAAAALRLALDVEEGRPFPFVAFGPEREPDVPVRAIAALRASPGPPAGPDLRAVHTLHTCVVLADLRRSTRAVAERLHDAVAQARSS